MLTRTLLVLSLVATTLAAGCAAEDASSGVERLESRPPPTFAEGSVIADRSFSDDVEVADDRLVIAATSHQNVLSKVNVGTVIAGDRSTGMKKTNPYGFLRRVTAMEKSGKTVTLKTEKAELTDWIKDGRLDFSSKKSLLDPKAKLTPNRVVTKSLDLLANESQGGGGQGIADMVGAAIDKHVKVENASLTVKTSFEGYLDVRTSGLLGPLDPPQGASFKSVLTIEPSVAADVVISATNATALDKAWTGAEVTIPIAAPIPLTVSFKPELKCNLSVTGTASLTVGANIGAKGVFGFDGDVAIDHFDWNNLSKEPTVSGGLALKKIEGKATASIRCELVAIPKLLAFDAVGLEGRIGPYLKLTTDLCALANEGGSAGGITLREEHGITGNVSARVQVPLLDIGQNFEIASFGFPLDGGEHYLLGGPETCSLPLVDSCAGRADGLYCSEVAEGSAIVCEAGVIARGVQCIGAGKCVGGTPEAIQCK